MTPSAASIRPATEVDLPVINDIYNHYVVHSTATYQTEPETMDARRAWFARHGELHPVIVAEIDGVIVGWGSLSPFHPRAAYSRTVENSLYVDHRHQRQGIGRALLTELIIHGKQLHHHAIIALIDGEQTPSIALHTAFGFTHAGHLKQVGHKYDRWLDVVYMQKILE